jgi:hypothetical protein
VRLLLLLLLMETIVTTITIITTNQHDHNHSHTIIITTTITITCVRLLLSGDGPPALAQEDLPGERERRGEEWSGEEGERSEVK